MGVQQSLTLWSEHRLGLFENRVLREILSQIAENGRKLEKSA
jgi:hypothetical protein